MLSIYSNEKMATVIHLSLVLLWSGVNHRIIKIIVLCIWFSGTKQKNQKILQVQLYNLQISYTTCCLLW